MVRLPKVGDKVNIIEKENYVNGRLTTGVVGRLLSRRDEVHPRGNKVMLTNGRVGRVVSYVDEAGAQSYVDPTRREERTRELRGAKSAETPPLRRVDPSELPDKDDLR